MYKKISLLVLMCSSAMHAWSISNWWNGQDEAKSKNVCNQRSSETNIQYENLNNNDCDDKSFEMIYDHKNSDSTNGVNSSINHNDEDEDDAQIYDDNTSLNDSLSAHEEMIQNRENAIQIARETFEKNINNTVPTPRLPLVLSFGKKLNANHVAKSLEAHIDRAADLQPIQNIELTDDILRRYAQFSAREDAEAIQVVSRGSLSDNPNDAFYQPLRDNFINGTKELLKKFQHTGKIVKIHLPLSQQNGYTIFGFGQNILPARNHWVASTFEIQNGKLNVIVNDATGIQAKFYNNSGIQNLAQGLSDALNLKFGGITENRLYHQGILNTNDCGRYTTAYLGALARGEHLKKLNNAELYRQFTQQPFLNNIK